MNTKISPFWAAFKARTDLKEFGGCALLLFALQLKFNIEDILAVASTALTEGSGDKKADLVHIDAESEYAVIAQTYLAEKFKKEAPANKASDLNTAVLWLLAPPIEELPEHIKPHAGELRQAIRDGDIKSIHIWYVHNLPESKNVKNELSIVEQATKTIINQHFPGCEYIEVLASEVGISTLEEWYASKSTPILVPDEFNIPISGGFEISGPDWSAYITAIPAKWLYKQFHRYKNDLFSADIREYLGSRKADTNINYGIKQTAQNAPSHFLVYNNGVTALVNGYDLIEDETAIHIEGFSIVNGAQTTGAIGALDSPPNANAHVQVRFIKCTNADRVRSIVLYNNSQNKVAGPDFRSSDEIQRRLLTEFQQIPNVIYVPRRGGWEDIIKRRPNQLPSITAGQALAAFHNDPDIAYHQKSKLWEDDALYLRYFNKHTAAKHIVFAYSLLKAIEKKKLDLLNKSKNNKLIDIEKEEFKFFRKRGSIFLMTSAVAGCLEVFLNRPIPNSFKLIFKDNPSPNEAAVKWSSILESASSFAAYLAEGLSDGIRNRADVNKANQTFRSLVAATKDTNATIYAKFAQQVEFTT